MNNVEGKLFIEPERYEFTAASFHQFELARRDFFRILGAGIAVFAIAKDAMVAQETAPGHRSFHNEELPKDISAWLHVGEDGSVTGFTGKAEIGQNIRTELAQTIAVSERYLNHCFQRELGIAPMTYLSRYRGQQAKLLLAAPLTYLVWFKQPHVYPKIQEFESLCAGKVQPGSSAEDVRQNTGFDLRGSPSVAVTPPPTAEELHMLRTVVKEKLARSYPAFVREKILSA